MIITRDKSEQSVVSLAVPDITGAERQVVSASSSIRPGKGVSINVDVLAAESLASLASDDLLGISVELVEFIQTELEKAAATGVPVCLPADR